MSALTLAARQVRGWRVGQTARQFRVVDMTMQEQQVGPEGAHECLRQAVAKAGGVAFIKVDSAPVFYGYPKNLE